MEGVEVEVDVCDNAEKSRDEKTRVLLPTTFTMMLLPTPLMVLPRSESLKSDNAEEAHDESDKGIAAQAVHNDGTTDTTNDTTEEGVTKVRQL